MTTLIVATRNSHKLQEITAILGDALGYRSIRDFAGVPEVIENGLTFADNASKKALELALWLSAQPRALKDTLSTAACIDQGQLPAADLYCLADDSGLEVDALNGAPGVHSARFAALDTGQAGNSSDQANNAKLLRLLDGVPAAERTARFRCVMALIPVLFESHKLNSPVCYADEAELRTQLFTGVCEGHILEAPRGQSGFGYDPLFVPEGLGRSLAELGDQTKNRISHRAKALRLVQRALQRRSA